MTARDSLELNPLLLRLLKRGSWILLLLTCLMILVSIKFRTYMQEKIAAQLSQAVRNDLLMGNSAAALKILQPTIGDHFVRIAYQEQSEPLFVLTDGTDSRPLWGAVAREPLCLDESRSTCSGTLLFTYSRLALVPWVLLGAALTLGLLLLIFWIFRQHVSTYYAVQLKHHQEAALGRLSARICHDLKIPSMIFQQAAYVTNAADFLAMQPLLQNHLQRLHRMIEKLKRADVEGLVQIEVHRLTRAGLEGFLQSLVMKSGTLQVIMPESLNVRIDLEKFERSLGNLVLNAFQAGASTVKVILEASRTDLRVLVENDGPPMTPDMMRQFKSRERNAAFGGLGLEIVKDTVAAHAGECDLISTPEITRFTLVFPHALMETPEPEPIGTQLSPECNSIPHSLVYVDRPLMGVVSDHISAAERGSFQFTDDLTRLHDVCLLISREDEAIDFGLLHDIPVLVAAAEDAAWIQALKSRLRLLHRVRTRSMS